MQGKAQVWFYGIRTLGRNMVYGFVTFYLMFYLTDALILSKPTIIELTIIIMVLRIFDALNDPLVGVLVDDTRSRFGKFKPWIFGRALSSALFTVLLFTDFALRGTHFLVLFGIIYLFWGISYTANDIDY